ncbi:uncharacterized protein N7484_000528 [Penicillium longicatenatum]|uniref:uncharacterized protein n=1 Tax=Penicillium longicatenatum TaxID=1561947 RepID=UPI002547932F|nr:uncharacterized protein N7484_000528 [Penicillium longicatenatum]KAJ5661156.1 hypothetical protein N7484_000528 [Penicillium longicatenatum]
MVLYHLSHNLYPQSDAAFPRIFDPIKSYTKSAFNKEFEFCLEDGHMPEGAKAYWDALWAKSQPRLIDDATQFDGASIDNARSHFEAWTSEQKMQDRFPSYRMFILVDEESLQTLLTTPIPEGLGWNKERWKHYVKLVEAWQESDSPYMGWMKYSLEGIWSLWANMEDGCYMRSSFMMVHDYRDVY